MYFRRSSDYETSSLKRFSVIIFKKIIIKKQLALIKMSMWRKRQELVKRKTRVSVSCQEP